MYNIIYIFSKLFVILFHKWKIIQIIYYILYILLDSICIHYKLQAKVLNKTSQNWGAHIYPKSAQSVSLGKSMTEADTEYNSTGQLQFSQLLLT